MPGGRLTQQERRRIAAGLAGGLSYAEIARRLRRPTSTISREVSRNGGPAGYRHGEAWYHSIVISAQQTLEAAQVAMEAAEALGPDSPVGRRLAKGGAFLEHVIHDMRDSADRWRPLLT